MTPPQQKAKTVSAPAVPDCANTAAAAKSKLEAAAKKTTTFTEKPSAAELANPLGRANEKMKEFYSNMVAYAWSTLSALVLSGEIKGLDMVPLEDLLPLTIENNKVTDLSTTREAWSYQNSMESLRTTGFYEAALTAFVFGQSLSAKSTTFVELGLDEVQGSLYLYPLWSC